MLEAYLSLQEASNARRGSDSDMIAVPKDDLMYLLWFTRDLEQEVQEFHEGRLYP